MIPSWVLWVVVVFLTAVVAELLRVNALLARNILHEASLDNQTGHYMDNPAPLISVIVPARDEEQHVGTCLQSILDSNYKNIEIIAVDDRSRDRTPDVMTSLADRDPRVRVIRVTELPEGWTGKTHALDCGVKQASGGILLFTDADTLFQQQLLSLTVNFFQSEDLDMLSMLPGFVERGFVEKALYPHMVLGLSYFFPLSHVNDPHKEAGLASGSFIMIKRSTYEELGTWEAFRKEITEDVALSKAVKAERGRLRVMRAGAMLRTRGFKNIGEMCKFWKRTYYGAFDRSLILTARLTANSFVLSMLPLLMGCTAYAEVLGKGETQVTWLLGLSSFAMLAVVIPFTVFLKTEGVHWAYGLTAPIGLVVASWVAVSTLGAVLFDKGIRWRGSLYK